MQLQEHFLDCGKFKSDITAKRSKVIYGNDSHNMSNNLRCQILYLWPFKCGLRLATRNLTILKGQCYI